MVRLLYLSISIGFLKAGFRAIEILPRGHRAKCPVNTMRHLNDVGMRQQLTRLLDLASKSDLLQRVHIE